LEQPAKPDFGDAGYGQVGCLFLVAGIVIGWLVCFPLGLVLQPALVIDGTAIVLITALGYIAGAAASALTGRLIDRTPRLWAHAGVVFVAMFAGAVVAIPVATYVPIVGTLAGPIVVLAIAVTVLPMIWFVVVRLWRGDW